MTVKLSAGQARRFILIRHGLIGEYRFSGKKGVLEFTRKTGCIQFDPVDVVGRSADICLNSRVKDYEKEMLDELLYKDRLLIDYFDKNLSIVPIEDFPLLLKSRIASGYVGAYEKRFGSMINNVIPLVRRLLEEREYLSSSDVGISETVDDGYWGVRTSLPRLALEMMYFKGELIIHHKNGTNKYYALAKNHIPKEILNRLPEYETGKELCADYVKRRITAVGLLWNKASDAFLGLSLKAGERRAAFEKLLLSGEIIEVSVEGNESAFYILIDDLPTVEEVFKEQSLLPRAEIIAPLDSFMWDRKLIKELFNFSYTWEIYTPKEKRIYGAYVLPVLYGDRLIGRVKTVKDRNASTLFAEKIWFEQGIEKTKEMLKSVELCLERFAAFNECTYKSI